MDSEYYLQRLSELRIEMASKTAKGVDKFKQSESNNWDPELEALGVSAMEDVSALHQEFSDVLAQFERWATDQGIEVPPAPQYRPDPTPRWWRGQLTTEDIEPTGDLNEVLEIGFPRLVRMVPREWLNAQNERYEAEISARLTEPLVLYSGQRIHSSELTIHRYAELLALTDRHLSGHDDFDVWSGAIGVPTIAALSLRLGAVEGTPGALQKLRELWQAPSNEVDSRIFELLVAGALTQRGRLVAMPEATSEISPDVRIFDLPYPAVAECKQQSWLSDGEKQEVEWVRQLFDYLVEHKRDRGLVGLISVESDDDLRNREPADIGGAILNLFQNISPYGDFAVEWGRVSVAPVSPSYGFSEVTRLYSAEFLREIFDWEPEASSYDGICAHVENNGTVRTRSAELPLGLRWRFQSKTAMRYKSRPIVRQLAEAFRQIPTGEAGFVYTSYRESQRRDVADRRTTEIRRLFESREFFIRRRRVVVPMMVITRLVANALGHGLPDLIENSIPLTEGADDLELVAYMHQTMPTRVYTPETP